MRALIDYMEVKLYKLNRVITWVDPWDLRDEKVIKLNHTHNRYEEACSYLNDIYNEMYELSSVDEIVSSLELLVDEYSRYLNSIYEVSICEEITYPLAYEDEDEEEEETLGDLIKSSLEIFDHLQDEAYDLSSKIEALYDSYKPLDMKVTVETQITHVTHVEYKGCTFTVDKLNRVKVLKVPASMRGSLYDKFPSKSKEDITKLRKAQSAFIEEARLAVKAQNLYVEVV